VRDEPVAGTLAGPHLVALANGREQYNDHRLRAITN
jgi:hypothetical protein